MTPQDFLDHTAAESAHFASAAAGMVDAPVQCLGDWTMRDLVLHLGQVYTVATGNVAAASTKIVPMGDEGQPPAEGDLMEWFAERRAAVLTALTDANFEAPAPTFAGPKTAGWWARRMAHETVIHRWDAETALKGIDGAHPIDSTLAADGVDEFIEVSLRFSSSRPDRIYPTESLHLHRSDGPGEWTLVSDGHGGVAVTHEHGKGDAAVRGPSSALMLWLWGRPTNDVQVFGDETVAAAWRALAP